MKGKTILFPTDFSDSSKAALEHATSLARDSGSSLLIVHVYDPAVVIADTGFAGYPLAGGEDAEVQARSMLEAVVPSDPAVPHAHRLLSGKPAEQIVDVAHQETVELIVMGSHGRRGLPRLLMGSVAEEVVRRAACPVLTVKQPLRESSHA